MFSGTLCLVCLESEASVNTQQQARVAARPSPHSAASNQNDDSIRVDNRGTNEEGEHRQRLPERTPGSGSGSGSKRAQDVGLKLD